MALWEGSGNGGSVVTKAEMSCSSPQNEQQEQLPEPFVRGGPAQTCELRYRQLNR